MKYCTPYFILLLSLTLVYGCNGLDMNNQAERLAKVGNEYLTLEEAKEEIPDFLLQEDSVSAIKAYREDWVHRKIVLQEAQRLRLHQNEDVQEQLERARQEVLTKALKDFVLAEYDKELAVSEEEARNYYQANKHKFVLNEQYVRFRHVETADFATAQKARQALLSGVEWPEVARKYSIKPENKINKSEQFWPISMALADLNRMNRYLRLIGRTEISDIERINRNYHFVQLIDTKAKGEHPDLDWLIEQIRDWLIIEKRRRHYNSYIKNLYLKAESNNEIDIYNVLESNNNSHKSISDTLETTQTSE